MAQLEFMRGYVTQKLSIISSHNDFARRNEYIGDIVEKINHNLTRQRNGWQLNAFHAKRLIDTINEKDIFVYFRQNPNREGVSFVKDSVKGVYHIYNLL